MTLGQTEVAVSDGVAGARCSTFGNARSGVVGNELPGRTVTLLRVRDGRVASILIGIVID